MEGKIRSISEAVSFAMNGDNDGYNYLYEKTWKNKYYVALKYMKNDEDAADVLQDAYMKAFQNLSMLNDPAKFEGWLGMIVANTAKNKLRVKNPVLFSEMDQDNGEGDIVEFQDLLIEERADFNPEERYSKVETAELVNELLGSLPEDQKICMIMFYLEGQSLEEIATALECSKNTVASRLNYGRKKIKAKGEELEKRGYKLYGVSPIVLLALLLRAERHTSLYGAAAATTAAAGTTAAVSTAEGTAAAGSAVSGTAVGSTVSGASRSAVGDLTAGELIDSIAAGQAGSVISGATAGGAATTAGTVVGATVAGGTVAGMVAGEVIDGVVAAQTGASTAAASEMGGAIAGEGAGSAVAGGSAQAGAGTVGSSISQSGAGAVGNMSAQAGASVQANSAAGATNGATAGGAIGSGSAAGGSSSSSIAGKAVGETVKKGASGAAKKGFLSTVAGKTVAAIAGVAVVGGLVAGTIVLTNKDKDKDKEELTTVVTEVVSTEDVTEIGSTDVTTEVISSEEPTTEVVVRTDEEILQAYLEEKLIPEDGKYGGIFDPRNEYYMSGSAQNVVMVTSIGYDETNDKLTFEYSERKVSDSDAQDSAVDYPEKNNPDYSKLYAAEILDTDMDGKQELLVIYKLSDNDSIYADVYTVSDDKNVEINKDKDGNAQEKISIFRYNVEGFDQFIGVYLMTQDGRVKLVIKQITNISNGTDAFFDYGPIPATDNAKFTVITVDDMKKEKELKYENFNPFGDVTYYLLDNNGNEISQGTFEQTAFASEPDDNFEMTWMYDTNVHYYYVGIPKTEFLQSIGFFGDDVKLIWAVRSINDLQRKYLFHSNKEGTEESSTENTENITEDTVTDTTEAGTEASSGSGLVVGDKSTYVDNLEDTGWCQAYLDKLGSDFKKDFYFVYESGSTNNITLRDDTEFKYDLVFINDDQIPEMVISGKNDLGEIYISVFAFQGDDMTAKKIGTSMFQYRRSVDYVPFKNIISSGYFSTLGESETECYGMTEDGTNLVRVEKVDFGGMKNLSGTMDKDEIEELLTQIQAK